MLSKRTMYIWQMVSGTVIPILVLDTLVDCSRIVIHSDIDICYLLSGLFKLFSVSDQLPISNGLDPDVSKYP